MFATSRHSAFAFALTLAALCFGAPAAHAQSSPVPYWTTAWPTGFGSGFTAAQSSTTYTGLSGLMGLDGSGVTGSFSSRYDLPNGWFVGNERGGTALNGFGSAWSNMSSLSYDGTQMGYNFKDAAVPVSIYAGFGTLKYNNAFAPPPLAGFDSQSASGASGYRVNAGVEFRPTSNLSVSFGASFSQQPSDPNAALLPGASPIYFGGRR
jgi:opacity protein-like surface antigen